MRRPYLASFEADGANGAMAYGLKADRRGLRKCIVKMAGCGRRFRTAGSDGDIRAGRWRSPRPAAWGRHSIRTGAILQQSGRATESRFWTDGKYRDSPRVRLLRFFWIDRGTPCIRTARKRFADPTGFGSQGSRMGPSLKRSLMAGMGRSIPPVYSSSSRQRVDL